MDKASNWQEVDELWDGYTESQTVALADSSPPLHENWGVSWWGELDTWWGSYADIGMLSLESELGTLNKELDAWSEVDEWWGEYADSQQEYLTELVDIVNTLNKEWRDSDCGFDRDPLTADWRRTASSAGPLRINQEENWSQWLAHLLRSSSGEFIDRLIGEGFDDSPDRVRREIVFHNSSGKDRRIDVLCEYASRGISIEVKIDDENYRKTLDTAELIEKQDYRDWLHILVLPKYKESSLRATFEDEIKEEGDDKTAISSSESEKVQVIYWEDIGLILRQTLLDDEEASPHWRASAYLLITLIEQRLRSFEPIVPEEGVEEVSSATHSEELWALKSVDIADQIDYLERAIGSDNNE